MVFHGLRYVLLNEVRAFNCGLDFNFLCVPTFTVNTNISVQSWISDYVIHIHINKKFCSVSFVCWPLPALFYWVSLTFLLLKFICLSCSQITDWFPLVFLMWDAMLFKRRATFLLQNTFKIGFQRIIFSEDWRNDWAWSFPTI